MSELIGSFLGAVSAYLKHSKFDIKGVWVSVLILAIMVAVCSFIITLAVVYLFKIKPTPVLGIMSGSLFIYPVNDVMKNMSHYIPRVGEIIDNASYILSFDVNRAVFFGALGIEDTEKNAKLIGRIVYNLNSSEWDKAIDKAGDMAWYLRRIRYSLHNTVYFFENDMGKPLFAQSASALLPIVLLMLIGIVFLIKKEVAPFACILGISVCLRTCQYGTTVFTFQAMAYYFLIYYSRFGFILNKIYYSRFGFDLNKIDKIGNGRIIS